MSAFGSRFLHYSMAHPLVQCEAIQERHRKVGTLLADSLYRRIRSAIQGSLDGERIIRRLEVQWKLNPGLIESMWKFLDMWRTVSDMWDLGLKEDEWCRVIGSLEDSFDRDALQKNRANRWEHPIDPTSVYKEKKQNIERRW